MKIRWLEKLAAVVCALCLAAGVMSGIVLAKDEEPSEETLQPEATFFVMDNASGEASAASVEIPEEIMDNRTTIPYSVNGVEYGVCQIVNGVPCVSVADFCQAIGVAAQTGSDGGVFTLTAEGLLLTASEADAYIICNGRCLYVEGGISEQNGAYLLPVEVLVKCFGVSALLDPVLWSVDIQNDGAVPLESGDTYYAETDVYWLSRLIYAEAGGQPLDAQIGIGNVIMNRIGSELFEEQDSVYDVIFAKNQFDVVVNGMIYMTPDETAVIAAKIALEGSDLVSGATYFAAGDVGSEFESVASIGDYRFMTAA